MRTRFPLALRVLFFAAVAGIVAMASGGGVAIGFEEASDLAAVRTPTPGVVLLRNTDPAGVREGRASLELRIEEAEEDGQIWPAVDVTFSPPIDLATVRAIECWVHVPAELAGYFYGRYDARLTINGRRPLWSRPAIEPGWTKLRWELSNLYTFPVASSLRLQLGPILPGHSGGRIHLDAIRLELMEPFAADSPSAWRHLAADATASWTARFQAIRRLEAVGGVEALPALFVASADGAPEEGFNPTAADQQPAYINAPPEGSEAVRSAARAALAAIAQRIEETDRLALQAELATALQSVDPRVRLAAVRTVAALGSAREVDWTEHALLRALEDELYYVREEALGALAPLGWAPPRVATHLGKRLHAGDPEGQQAAARCLSEMGSPARTALPAVLERLRDPAAPRRLRVWCLRAAWWIDESVLTADDWVLALGLQPGEVHRHLLNRAMDRLQKAGAAAVPALSAAARASDPEERARAAVLLRSAGPTAEAVLEALRADSAWYVRTAAGATEPSPEHADAPVVVMENEERIHFSNGLIEVEFDPQGQDPGPVSAHFPGGPNLIDGDWLYRVLSFKETNARSIIERVWFQKIYGVPLNKTLDWRWGVRTDDEAEIIFRYPGGGDAPLEWEFHYRLRRGESGLYSYIVVRNVTGHDLGEPRMFINQLVAPTWGLFDTAVLHDHFKWPAKFNPEPDFAGYPDIYQATYRMPDGTVDAKHEGVNHELASPVVGFCGPSGGVWQILPSLEFCGGSWPWDQKTGVNHNMFVLSLDNKYYLPTGLEITAGWEKVYGPIFHYFNRGENTEAMWADAKRQAAVEVARWPHAWMTVAGFQERGTVTGMLQFANGTSPEGAWALLARPTTTLPEGITFGSWWRDVGPYHYVAPVAADGSFELSHVRPGDYDLFIWRDGVHGEYRRKALRIEAGQTLDVGSCSFRPSDRGRLLWQIGEANRTVTEFRNGGNFHQWENYLRYRPDFPFDLHYDVARSDPARDWNYLQPAAVAGEARPTRATVAFDWDPAIPGDPVLTIVAGGRGVDLDLRLNGSPIGSLEIEAIGLQHIRTVPYGELTEHVFPFERSLLRPGRNELVLAFAGTAEATAEGAQWGYAHWTNYIAYDFIRLETVE